ncbi:hypothetical protein BDW59DRAFT_146746 [Aspergillus cavernicola]|uniref:Uncharacterized protein n=1 Tax=Aspergillus cavernicola TaxID=176166 RepID=A0ABR4IBG0_9EURO
MHFTHLLTATITAFAAVAVAAPSPSADICLKICYAEEPECASPSYAQQEGACWTCCTPS